MINKSIVISALARDCADNLEGNITRIEELRLNFAKSKVIVLENDSKDKTPIILKEWEKSSEGVKCISEPLSCDKIIDLHAKNPKYEDKSLWRISKMAYLRNRLIELSKEMGEFDLYMLLDIDVYSFSVDGILKALKKAPTDWGGLFANGCIKYIHNGYYTNMPLQYDVYAFFKEQEDIMSIDFCYLQEMNQFNRSRYMSYNINTQDYFACMSAFGGIGIYKYDLIRNLTYSAIVPHKFREENICLCEHLSVNNQICENGYKCYIARNMEVCYGLYEKKGLLGFLYRLSPMFYLRICRLIKSVL